MNEVVEYLKRTNGKVYEDFTDIFMNTNPLDIQDGVNEYEKEFGEIDWGVK